MRVNVRLSVSEAHPLVEEFLDEGFPEVFFDSFGLQHQPVM